LTSASPICNYLLNTYHDKIASGKLMHIAPILKKGDNPQNINFAAEAGR
jgi:hypothetical protein